MRARNPDFPQKGSSRPSGPRRATLPGLAGKLGISLALQGFFLLSGSFAQLQPEEPVEAVSTGRFGLLPFPILYYTPETGVAGGAALVGSHRANASDTSARPSSIVVDLIYTQKKQISAEVCPDVFLDSAMYHVIGLVHFSRYPLRFYGIGSDTPEEFEEPYTSRAFRLSLDALRRIAGDLSGGISLLYETQTFSALHPGGLLEPGTIAGSRGGRTVGAGVVFHWDTRNNLFTPSSGRFYQLTLRASGRAIGSDFDFTYFNLDLRNFLPVAGRSVLAVQALASMTAGRAPFFFLPQLGGSDVMRGYFEGRYRDKDLLAVQVEYRFPIFWRVGGAVFAGAGTVAPEVTRFRIRHVKPGAGLGLRYMYDLVEKMNVRVDVGFGRNNMSVYITANEAF